MKFLLWGIIIAAIVLWVIRAKKTLRDTRESRHNTQQHSQQHTHRPARQEQRADESDAEPMLRCTHCGIHLPSSEAFTGKGGEVYCSVEHRRLHGS